MVIVVIHSTRSHRISIDRLDGRRHQILCHDLRVLLYLHVLKIPTGFLVWYVFAIAMIRRVQPRARKREPTLAVASSGGMIPKRYISGMGGKISVTNTKFGSLNS